MLNLSRVGTVTSCNLVHSMRNNSQLFKSMNIILLNSHLNNNTVTDLRGKRYYSTRPSEAPNSQQYCIDHVKKYDRENYLCSLVINEPKMRRVAFALRAFNVELALVREATTDTDRAKLRFHFWSKLLDDIFVDRDIYKFDEHRKESYYKFAPVANELIEIFERIQLDSNTKIWTRDLIGSRISSKVLGYQQFENINELIAYCLKSNASIYLLLCQFVKEVHFTYIDSRRLAPHLQVISENLGIAHGLSNIIRGIPYNANKNCCYVPKDLLQKYNCQPRDFFRTKSNQGKIKPIVKEMTNLCQSHLDIALKEMRGVPRFYKRIFSPRVTIKCFLDRLVAADHDIYNPALTVRDNLLPLKVWFVTKFK